MKPNSLGVLVRKLRGTCVQYDATPGDDLKSVWDSIEDGIGLLWFCYQCGVDDAKILACARECLKDDTVATAKAAIDQLLQRYGRFGRPSTPTWPNLFADVVRRHLSWDDLHACLTLDETGAQVPKTQRGS